MQHISQHKLLGSPVLLQKLYNKETVLGISLLEDIFGSSHPVIVHI